MEKGKSKMFIVFLEGIFFGFLLCLIAVFLYFNAPAIKQSPKEISLEEAISRIKNKEVSEVHFKETQLTIIDKNEQEFWSTLSSDAVKEAVLKTAGENNVGKISVEPRSSGLFWIVVFQIFPFVIIFGMLVFLIIIYNNHIKRKVEK